MAQVVPSATARKNRRVRLMRLVMAMIKNNTEADAMWIPKLAASVKQEK